MISHKSWHPGGRSAFTLIEISVTIAVLVILLVGGVSLMSGTGGSARKSGADMLAGMIEQARTTAITSRSYVVLAIAEPSDFSSGENRCRVGLFKVKTDQWPEKTSEPVLGVLMNRWRMLENGIVLIGGEQDDLQNPLDGPQLTITYGSDANSRTVEVHAMVFNPRGGLHYPSGSHPIALRIAEGGYRNGMAALNRRADTQAISENRIKIGRVSARPYRID